MGLKHIISQRIMHYPDERGWFMELSDKYLQNTGQRWNDFFQDNYSFSHEGVLRGLHFQKEPYAQDKFLVVVFGSIYDVVVDLNENSPQYGQYKVNEMETCTALYIPKGYAHGFYAMKESLIAYKVTGKYMPDYEGGIIWNDPTININWPSTSPIISDKDKAWPSFISNCYSPGGINE